VRGEVFRAAQLCFFCTKLTATMSWKAVCRAEVLEYGHIPISPWIAHLESFASLRSLLMELLQRGYYDHTGSRCEEGILPRLACLPHSYGSNDIDITQLQVMSLASQLRPLWGHQRSRPSSYWTSSPPSSTMTRPFNSPPTVLQELLMHTASCSFCLRISTLAKLPGWTPRTPGHQMTIQDHIKWSHLLLCAWLLVPGHGMASNSIIERISRQHGSTFRNTYCFKKQSSKDSPLLLHDMRMPLWNSLLQMAQNPQLNQKETKIFS